MDLYVDIPAEDQNFTENVLRPLAIQFIQQQQMQIPQVHNLQNFDPFQVLPQAEIEQALQGHNDGLRQAH
jgi:hypothetical protein